MNMVNDSMRNAQFIYAIHLGERQRNSAVIRDYAFLRAQGNKSMRVYISYTVYTTELDIRNDSILGENTANWA